MQPVPADTTYHQLSKQLAQLGAASVVDVLGDFDARLRSATAQDESRVTKAPKVHKDDGVLRFDRDAEEAYTRWRAFGDNIGIHAFAGNRRIRFLNLSLASADHAGGSPGELTFKKEARLLHIACAKGALHSNSVQVAGKAVQSAADFANGYLRNNPVIQLSAAEPADK